ncbi:MAG: hypothetical protein ACYS99_20855, partial [Planctomycetota bacterium]
RRQGLARPENVETTGRSREVWFAIQPSDRSPDTSTLLSLNSLISRPPLMEEDDGEFPSSTAKEAKEAKEGPLEQGSETPAPAKEAKEAKKASSVVRI